MATEQNGNSRYLAFASIWAGTCISCALAIIYFFGLLGAGTVDPFRNHFEQGMAALRTALVATLAPSSAIWLGATRKRGLAIVILRTGLVMQIALTLYALLGWRSPSFLNIIFPSTFFAEYNWLAFIFEVAPATSVAAGLLSCAMMFLSHRGVDEESSIRK